jgi:hypothetical protein
MGILETFIVGYALLMTLFLGIYSIIFTVSIISVIISAMWEDSIRGYVDGFKENFENMLKQRKNK